MRHALPAIIVLLIATPLTLVAGSPLTDIAINEVNYLQGANQDWVELKNQGVGTIDVSTWWVCARFTYRQLSLQTLLDGTDLNLGPGEIVTIQLDFNINDTSSDFGLYSTNNFASAAAMVDFLQFGTSADVGRSDVAVTKGIWTETSPAVYDFVATASGSETIQFDGSNGGGSLLSLSSDFGNFAATRSAENSNIPVVFADGFESGDTTAWTSAAP